MPVKRCSFVDQIRRAVDASGMSRYALGKQIGMDKAVMSRFMSGKGFLSEDSMNRLTHALKLIVVAPEMDSTKSDRKQG